MKIGKTGRRRISPESRDRAPATISPTPSLNYAQVASGNAVLNINNNNTGDNSGVVPTSPIGSSPIPASPSFPSSTSPIPSMVDPLGNSPALDLQGVSFNYFYISFIHCVYQLHLLQTVYITNRRKEARGD